MGLQIRQKLSSLGPLLAIDAPAIVLGLLLLGLLFAFVPQGRYLFGQLSAYENLALGGITLGRKTTQSRMPEVLARFPRLNERLHSAAPPLSGGEQKQLAVGRALLLLRAKVLLIDEPSIGQSPRVVADVFALLRKRAIQGCSELMVAQNVKSASTMADEAIALESGRVVVLHKAVGELLNAPNIESLFLGGGHAPAIAPVPACAAQQLSRSGGCDHLGWNLMVLAATLGDLERPHPVAQGHAAGQRPAQ